MFMIRSTCGMVNGPGAKSVHRPGSLTIVKWIRFKIVQFKVEFFRYLDLGVKV
jgi:hypothetical protein